MSIFAKALILISLVGLNKANASHVFTTGTFVQNFNKTQASDSGATTKFDLVPYIGYGRQFHLSGAHYFMPEIALAYYLENAEKVSRRTVFLHYDFSYIASQRFILRYGLTTYWYTIDGDGGSVNLRNGDSYSEFPAPDGAVTSYYTTVDFGAEFFINPRRALRLDFNLMNVRDWDNRILNYILTYNWYL